MTKYNAIRNRIRTGDILAWAHRGGWFRSLYDFKVNLVRLFTRSEYSHVGIAVVLAGRVFVLESVTGGVRLFPLSKCVPCYWVKYRKPFDLDRALSAYGEPYSQWEAILGRFDANDPSDGKWQCAEFVAWAHGMTCTATPSGVMDYTLRMGGVMHEVA